MADINSTKPKSDLKEYRLLTLPQSGLEALLVDSTKLANSRHDTSVESLADSHKAAAAMCVCVGSFADPLEAQGMAHFLEHMVFMGIDSDKYPNSENLYDAFISSHGGSCNAMTDGEYTVYQFDVTAEHFPEALDIFAHCFKSPLLSMSAADREIKSIDSEFNIAKMSDGARLQQLLCDAARDKHVLRKFSWGNMESLSTLPKRNKVDIHAILRAFYRKHYLPENMKLVVIAPKSLDELENDVKQCFGEWVPLPVPPPSSTSSGGANGGTGSGKKSAKGRKTTSSQHSPHSPPALTSLEDCIGPYRDVNPFVRVASGGTKGAFGKGGVVMGSITRIVPIKKVHKLILTWSLPSMIRDYKSKPAGYVSHLLGHEGAGSLLSALKGQGLATGVSAGISSQNVESNSMFSVFAVSISLTVKGLANWTMVVQKVFEYIALLRVTGPLPWIFDEIKRVSAMDYHYADEEDECDFVERLAIEMAPCHGRERVDLLTAQSLLWDFDAAGISGVVGKMTPESCMFSLLSSAFRWKGGDDDDDDDDDEDDEDDDEDDDDDDDDEDDDEDDDDDSEDDEDSDEAGGEDLSNERLSALYSGPDEWRALCTLPTAPGDSKKKAPKDPSREKHFGTVYWREPVPPQLLKTWGAVTPAAEMALPTPNPFIPEDLALVDSLHLVQEAKIGETVPVQVVAEDGLSVWHLVDTNFPLPKAQISCQFASPLPQRSARQAAMHDLFVKCLADSTTELLYMASMAELNCDIIGTANAFVLKVYGFCDKACLLMERVVGTVFDLSSYLTSEIVERQCEVLKRVYSNACLKSSDAAATGRLLSLVPGRFASEVKLAAMRGLETDGLLGTMQAYMTELLGGGLSIDAFVHGNVPEAKAVGLAHTLRGCVDTFVQTHSAGSASTAGSGLSATANQPPQVVLLPPRTLTLAVAPRDPSEKNICLEAYYQVGPYEGRVDHLTLLDLLEQCLTEPFFDQLRTQQQLGYSVSCGVRQTYGMLGFCFQVVSSAHPVPFVQSAVMAFVDTIPTLLADITPADFHNHVNSLMSDKLKPDKSLYDASSTFWYEMTEGSMEFLLRKKQADFLREGLVDMERLRSRLVAFVRHHLMDVMQCRLLLVQASLETSIVSAKGTDEEPAPAPAAHHARNAHEVHAMGTTVVMSRTLKTV